LAGPAAPLLLPPFPLGRLARRPSRPLPRAAHLAHPASSSPTPKTLGRALPQPPPPPPGGARSSAPPPLPPTSFSLPDPAHIPLSLPRRRSPSPSLAPPSHRPPLQRPRRPGAAPARRARPLAPVAGAARRPYGSRARPPASPGGMGARRSRPGRRPRPRRLRRGRATPARAAWARPSDVQPVSAAARQPSRMAYAAGRHGLPARWLSTPSHGPAVASPGAQRGQAPLVRGVARVPTARPGAASA
jgi:hypothetical protein